MPTEEEIKHQFPHIRNNPTAIQQQLANEIAQARQQQERIKKTFTETVTKKGLSVEKKIIKLSREIQTIETKLQQFNIQHNRVFNPNQLTIAELGKLLSIIGCAIPIARLNELCHAKVLHKNFYIQTLSDLASDVYPFLDKIQEVAHQEGSFESSDLVLVNFRKEAALKGRSKAHEPYFDKLSPAPHMHTAILFAGEQDIVLNFHQVMQFSLDQIAISEELTYDRYAIQPFGNAAVTRKGKQALTELFSLDSMTDDEKGIYATYLRDDKTIDIHRAIHDELAATFEEIVNLETIDDEGVRIAIDPLSMPATAWDSYENLQLWIDEENSKRRESGQNELSIEQMLEPSIEEDLTTISEMKLPKKVQLAPLQETADEAAQNVEETEEILEMRKTIESIKYSFRNNRRYEVFDKMRNTDKLQLQAFKNSWLLSRPLGFFIRSFSKKIRPENIKTEGPMICSQFGFIMTLKALARFELKMKAQLMYMYMDRKKYSEKQALQEVKKIGPLFKIPKVTETELKSMTPGMVDQTLLPFFEPQDAPKIYQELFEVDDPSFFAPAKIDTSVGKLAIGMGSILLDLMNPKKILPKPKVGKKKKLS